MAVPPLVRTQARVTRLNKFEVGDVASLYPKGAAMQQDQK